MATNAQVAYQAAAIKQETLREVDLESRAEGFFTWLEAQPSGTAKAIGDAQAALTGAAHAYDHREGQDPVNDVTSHAAQLLTDITAHAAGNGS